MRTTKPGYFSSYWPVVLGLVLIVLAVLQAYGDGGATREPLTADRVTAELARTVSYGLIDSGHAHAAPAMRSAVARPAMPEAS